MACPICRKPAAWEGNLWRPFCSERCQLVDLGTWASEGYRVASAPWAPDENDDGEVKP